MAEFNPYHKWLGIPLNEQPPNHYRLLGITLFESDPDVIETAADRQMAHVQRYKTGQYSRTSQDLLNELSAAKLCLLVPARKAAYDETLRQTHAPNPLPRAAAGNLPRATALPPTKVAASLEVVSVTPISSPRSAPQPIRKFRPVVLALSGGVILAGLAAVWLAFGRSDPDPPNQQAELPVAAAPATVAPGAQPAARATVAAETRFKLAAHAAQSIPEGNVLVLRVKSEPAGEDGSMLFELAEGAPAGVQLDAQTGELRWQTTEDQGPGSYRLGIRLLETATRTLLDQQSLQVWVREVDQPPQLQVQSTSINQSGISIQLRGTDPDIPARKLTYSLEAGSPATARIDAETGLITWQPDASLMGKPVELIVRATEEGAEGRFAVRKISFTLPAASSTAPAVASNTTATTPAATALTEPPPAGTAEKPAAVQPAERAAIPDEASQSAALAKIKEIFSEQYKQRKPEERVALARELLQAFATATEMPARFVLLEEARTAAMAGGDMSLAWQAIDAQAAQFDVDGVDLKSAALKKAPATRTTDDARALANLYATVIDEAARADRFDVALGLGPTGIQIAQRSKELPLVSKLQERIKELRLAKKDYEAAQAAAEKLKVSPDDAAANLALGTYECFVKQRWPDGLKLLVKCGEEKLSAAAKLDLANPTTDKDRLAVGDAWWAAAEGERGVEKDRYQQRAARWYREVLPLLTGLDRIKLDKKLQGVPVAANMSASPTTSPAFPSPTGSSSPQPAPAPQPLGRTATIGGTPGDPKHERAVAEALLATRMAYQVQANINGAMNSYHQGPLPAGDVKIIQLGISANPSIAGDEILLGLKGLKHLESLSVINANRLTDSAFEVIGQMPTLKSLALSSLNISDAGMRHLSRLTELETLHLAHSSITDAGVRPLASLGKLRSVNLEDMQNLTDEALRVLAGLPNLNELNVSSKGITGAGLSQLKNASLTRLELRTENLHDVHLGHLQSLTRLQTVRLTGNISDTVFVPLGKLADLQSLQIGGNGITGNGIGNLAACRALTQLTLDSNQISDAALTEIAKIKTLSTLRLTNCNSMTGANFGALADSSLRTLHLGNATSLRDSAVAQLVRLPVLSDISISQSPQLGDEAMVSLAKARSLERLSISGQRITDAGLASLKTCTNLRSISLSRTSVSDQGVAALQQLLPNCRVYKNR